MDTIDLSEDAGHEVVEGVYLAQLAASTRMSVQHYHFEPKSVVPEHSHEHEQVGFVYRGAVTFVVAGEEVVIETGDSYALAANEPHEVINHGNDPAMGIDVFSPPRGDPDWAES